MSARSKVNRVLSGLTRREASSMDEAISACGCVSIVSLFCWPVSVAVKVLRLADFRPRGPEKSLMDSKMHNYLQFNQRKNNYNKYIKMIRLLHVSTQNVSFSGSLHFHLAKLHKYNCSCSCNCTYVIYLFIYLNLKYFGSSNHFGNSLLIKIEF